LGQAHISDETCANCIDQASSCLFYEIAAVKKFLIYGADVSNAFAEAPLPKQGYYIYPDQAFHDWWMHHKKNPPLAPGMVKGILLDMQEHPKSPQLWKKHADAILCNIGLTPTVHKPCLYLGIIAGKHVIFKQKINDLAIAAPDERMSNIIFDMIDNEL
jgi:hypothetical protein